MIQNSDGYDFGMWLLWVEQPDTLTNLVQSTGA